LAPQCFPVRQNNKLPKCAIEVWQSAFLDIVKSANALKIKLESGGPQVAQ
jgi:hypothetical protein